MANPSRLFILRPVATALLTAAILLAGSVAYLLLPISALPQVDYPTLNVNASLPGADPGTMASSVASPLERQFTTIAGLDSMTSRSGSGSTNITLQFDLGRDIDSATVDVQTAIAAVMPLLPSGAGQSLWCITKTGLTSHQIGPVLTRELSTTWL